jgi:DNA-binding NtrC family response regulator
MTPGSDKCIVDVDVLSKYIPREEPNLLPAMSPAYQEPPESAAEREAIIRSIFQLKQDVEYLKDVLAKAGLTRQSAPAIAPPEPQMPVHQDVPHDMYEYDEDPEDQELEEREPEDMSIRKASNELIVKVLNKHDGNRKAAAAELGISERTLYRKLKQIK